MLNLIEALNYRALRYVRQPIGSLHVLVGANATGKTTFLDVPAFLGRLVSNGLDAALSERTANFQDLTWLRKGDGFQLAVEARVPEALKTSKTDRFSTVRYEVHVGIDETDQVSLLAESVFLLNEPQSSGSNWAPSSILTPKGKQRKAVVNKIAGGNDSFYPETPKSPSPSFKLGPRRSAFGNLPEDDSQFPIATWLRRLLVEKQQQIVLNSLLIRRASPPGQRTGFRPDGSNLPWVVAELQANNPERFASWLRHVQTALPDLQSLRTIERADDKHRYLMLKYQGGLEIPSWMASDGTLRLLALTLPAYLMEFKGVYLIEEPENGIHPRAIEAVFQSLSSAYDAQILLATHSPVILSVVDASTVLCFSKDETGATQIVQGDHHPALANWKGETNLGVLFAGGVLG